MSLLDLIRKIGGRPPSHDGSPESGPEPQPGLGTVTRFIEMDGIGSVRLDSGEVIRFGMSAWRSGNRPELGVQVRVESVGPHPMGGWRASSLLLADDPEPRERAVGVGSGWLNGLSVLLPREGMTAEGMGVRVLSSNVRADILDSPYPYELDLRLADDELSEAPAYIALMFHVPSFARANDALELAAAFLDGGALAVVAPFAGHFVAGNPDFVDPVSVFVDVAYDHHTGSCSSYGMEIFGLLDAILRGVQDPKTAEEIVRHICRIQVTEQRAFRSRDTAQAAGHTVVGKVRAELLLLDVC